mgnify:CR=1 FL=1
MPPVSRSHLVLIPSYNTGDRVVEVVRAAAQRWLPVWVVVDGSTDGTTEALQTLAACEPGLRVIALPSNQGKGAAMLAGLEAALAAGYTHALAMDADGQHAVAQIPDFMALSEMQPEAMILGLPVFGAEAPPVRVYGRRICNLWTNIETLWHGIGDALFGYRVYPIAALVGIMRRSRWMRRFDFDAEAATRMAWQGVPAVNLLSPVTYFTPLQGGISHFRYLRDNLLLIWMHLRLLAEFILRLPAVIAYRIGNGRRAPVISSRR